MESKISIAKGDGTVVPFDVGKLYTSLERSGAGEVLINEIISDIEGKLSGEVTTKVIYKMAFSLLRKKSKGSAAKYKLRRAITELGPTGYPFERFVGQLLTHQGYKVEVGVMVQGKCIAHEIDVVAEKEGKHYMVECKFHSDQNRKCGVQVPLYINSRFLDIKNLWERQEANVRDFQEGWIVTNTRFSEEAITYARCVGLKLMGWDFPRKGSLKERIESSGLHPITCLSTLNRKEKQRLLDLGLVLCSELRDDISQLQKANIDPRKERRIKREIDELLGE